MENLFTHLKDVFSTEPFSENQSAFTITVYTNLDYLRSSLRLCKAIKREARMDTYC